MFKFSALPTPNPESGNGEHSVGSGLGEGVGSRYLDVGLDNSEGASGGGEGVLHGLGTRGRHVGGGTADLGGGDGGSGGNVGAEGGVGNAVHVVSSVISITLKGNPGLDDVVGGGGGIGDDMVGENSAGNAGDDSDGDVTLGGGLGIETSTIGKAGGLGDGDTLGSGDDSEKGNNGRQWSRQFDRRLRRRTRTWGRLRGRGCRWSWSGRREGNAVSFGESLGKHLARLVVEG
jgi:hypothetical protein